jgi:hypothetical protein
MCCPNIGWVIYDQHENTYALCERASVGQGDDSDQGTGISPEEARMIERRQKLDDRRLALEERQFQQRVQTLMLKGQIQRAQAAAAATPQAIAARREAAAAAMAASARRAAADKAAQQKKLAYAAAAALAAKLLFFS